MKVFNRGTIKCLVAFAFAFETNSVKQEAPSLVPDFEQRYI
jgi:hypothetical protein